MADLSEWRVRIIDDRWNGLTVKLVIFRRRGGQSEYITEIGQAVKVTRLEDDEAAPDVDPVLHVPHDVLPALLDALLQYLGNPAHEAAETKGRLAATEAALDVERRRVDSIVDNLARRVATT